ncbi:MAG: AraC family transcriptional regulator [Bacteroidales bacterium]|nr:AraC family transcriptional regulator [Bacteroidales bacterium]
MEKYNIINEDVYASDNIDDLGKIFSGKDKNTPMAIFMCSEGEISFIINGKENIIGRRQILILGPHTVIEKFSKSEDFKGIGLFISERTLFDNIDNIIWENAFTIGQHPVITVNENTERLYKYYGKLFQLRLALNDRMYRNEVISSLLKAMILELMHEIKSIDKHIETPGKSLIRQGDILFKRFITLLAKTEIKPRMVSWYAQELCVTPKYLSTTCKNVSGKSANSWINEFVVRDIHRLLKYSDKSIKEICDYLEFPNLSFFGKYVKAHLGYSPKEYRKRIKTMI